MEGYNQNAVRYPCNFCDKVFFSYQALGGHQNSHRQERDFAVRRLAEGSYPMQTAPRLQPSSLDRAICTHIPNVEMQTAPQAHPLLRRAIRPHVRPNAENVQMPRRSNHHFRRPSYLPTHLNPTGRSAFRPYGHRSHFYQNSFPNVGFRYPSTNPILPTSGYPTHCLPTAQQQVNSYAKSQTYNLFGAENGGSGASGTQVDILTSNPSIGGEERCWRPSNSMAEKHTGANDNGNGEIGANDKLDLTLRL